MTGALNSLFADLTSLKMSVCAHTNTPPECFHLNPDTSTPPHTCSTIRTLLFMYHNVSHTCFLCIFGADDTVNRTPRKMQHRTCGIPAVVGMLLLGWYGCTLRRTPQCPAHHPTCSHHGPRAGRITSALGYIVIILVLRHLDLDSSVERHEFLKPTK